MKQEYNEYYKPTIDETFIKKTTIDGKDVTLDIFDCCELEEYSKIYDEEVKTSHIIIIMYSITDLSSFNNLKNICNDIYRVNNQIIIVKRRLLYNIIINIGSPILVIGNKLDLLDEREVSYDEGGEFANKYKTSFIEISAKANLNVYEVFSECVFLYYKNFEKWTNSFYKHRENSKKEIKNNNEKKFGLFASISDVDNIEIKKKKN
jgi:GTPase SAR1 family protein